LNIVFKAVADSASIPLIAVIALRISSAASGFDENFFLAVERLFFGIVLLPGLHHNVVRKAHSAVVVAFCDRWSFEGLRNLRFFAASHPRQPR